MMRIASVDYSQGEPLAARAEHKEGWRHWPLAAPLAAV